MTPWMICVMFRWDILLPQHPVVSMFDHPQWSLRLRRTTSYMRWLETTSHLLVIPPFFPMTFPVTTIFVGQKFNVWRLSGCLMDPLFKRYAIPGLAKHSFRDCRSSDIWPGGLHHRRLCCSGGLAPGGSRTRVKKNVFLTRSMWCSSPVGICGPDNNYPLVI